MLGSLKNDHRPIHNSSKLPSKLANSKVSLKNKELIKSEQADIVESNMTHPQKNISENEIGSLAKKLSEESNSSDKKNIKLKSVEAEGKAIETANKIKGTTHLPIASALNRNNLTPLSQDEIKSLPPREYYLKKPAVIFIEGFSLFGISNGDGIQEMSESFPGAKRFSWTEHQEIISEIKKRSADQPIILVGHSFGGDTAVEIANELNTLQHGFRPIDLLVSIDAVGMNKNIIPINVQKNLNFFGEGVIPFLHGDPTVARNTKYTEVVNELRSDLHSRMEDSPEVQFQIFEQINQVLKDKSNIPEN